LEDVAVKITPVDIQHKQFRKVLQGYSREEVDSFLDEVIETLEEQIEERTKLESRIGELQEKLAHFKAMESSLQSTLVLAQRTADEVKASAHKEVDLIKQRAKLELDGELGEIKGRIADARRELQRHHDHIAQAKQDLRGFLARHASLLDEDVAVAADAGIAPPIPLPGGERHEELLRESS
jgi:cell division initiation protein